MATSVKQLTVSVSVSNTWTQMAVNGSVYTVPVGGRATMIFHKAMNLGANSMVIDVGISDDSTIDDIEKIAPPITLAQNESFDDDGHFVLRAGQGVWVRAVGTSPTVIGIATLHEVT